MAQNYGFFDGAALNQTQFAWYGVLLADTGVERGAEQDLAVQSTAPPALKVRVRPGRAMIQGYWYTNTSDVELTVDGNTSGNPRIDRVVLRLDLDSKTIGVAVRKGTAAASPTAPAAVQDLTGARIWELSLATVTVPSGANRVENGAGGQGSVSTSVGSYMGYAQHRHQHGQGAWDAVDPDWTQPWAKLGVTGSQEQLVRPGETETLKFRHTYAGGDPAVRVDESTLKATKTGLWVFEANVEWEYAAGVQFFTELFGAGGLPHSNGSTLDRESVKQGGGSPRVVRTRVSYRGPVTSGQTVQVKSSHDGGGVQRFTTLSTFTGYYLRRL